MLRIFKWLLVLGIGLPAMLVVSVLFSGFQKTPWVVAEQRLDEQNVARLKTVLDVLDPRRMKIGDHRTLILRSDDLNLLLNYAVAKFVTGGIHVDLSVDALDTQLSIAAPGALPHAWFNTRFKLERAGQGFRAREWRCGSLPLPDWLTNGIAQFIHHLAKKWDPYDTAWNSVEKISVSPVELSVAFNWQQELKDQLRHTGKLVLFDDAEQRRLRFYHERLFAMSNEINRRSSLKDVLARLFHSASERSEDAGQAVLENRALLSALALHLAHVQTNNFLAEPGSELTYGWLFFPTLRGREDLARHFAISAGITALSDSRLSDAAGLFKELKDSQGGSGFSFADLAADRAGTRLAELALNPDFSLQAQQILMSTKSESVFMPDIRQLPEGLQEREFTDFYQDLDNHAYRDLRAEIERRINACGLYGGS